MPFPVLFGQKKNLKLMLKHDHFDQIYFPASGTFVRKIGSSLLKRGKGSVEFLNSI